MGGERSQEADRLGRDRAPARLVVPGEEPHRLAPGDHRHHNEVPGAQAGRHRRHVLRLEVQLGGEWVLLVEHEGYPLAVSLVHRPRLDQGDLDALEGLELLFRDDAELRQRDPAFVAAYERYSQ